MIEDQIRVKRKLQSCITQGSVSEKLVTSFVLLALIAIITTYYLITLLALSGFLL